MKVISLNSWGGKLMEPFMEFLTKNRDVDIFCFQEVYHEAHGKDTIWVDGSNFNFLNDIKPLLADYDCFYHPHLDDWWGLASFIHKGIDVMDQGEYYVHKFKGHDPVKEPHGYTAKNIQYMKIKSCNKAITIMNFHGLWNGGGKSDSDDRLTQSRNIVDFINKAQGKDGEKSEIIFCGDFNLEPTTESLRMIARETGLHDLIKEYGVTSTRTSHYKKPVRFADYMFVSKGIDVIDFKILPDEASDHSPLYLEFN